MTDFTLEQQRCIMAYYRDFQQMLAGRSCDASTAEALLAATFPGMDREKIHADCILMEAGIQRFMDACGDSNMDAADAVEKLTRNMNAHQRKGFFLTVYDNFRKYDAVNYSEAEQAQEGRELVREVDEAELKDMIIDQVSAHAQIITSECAEGGLAERPMEDTLPDPMLMAMANYAASVDGTLPEFYEKSPEIMGVFAASSCAVAKEIHDNPEKAGNRKWLADVVVGIVGIALLVALAAWCAPVAAEGIKQVFVAISTGNWGLLLARFKYPLLHFLKNLKYFLPAAAIAAMGNMSDLAEEAMDKLRGVYRKVKSTIRVKAVNEQSEKIREAVKTKDAVQYDEEDEFEDDYY